MFHTLDNMVLVNSRHSWQSINMAGLPQCAALKLPRPCRLQAIFLDRTVGSNLEVLAQGHCAWGGSMSLLLTRVYYNTIILVRRFLGNVIMIYLHKSAHDFMVVLVLRMFQHGYYTLIIPDHYV